jgi:hypothetical protein
METIKPLLINLANTRHLEYKELNTFVELLAFPNEFKEVIKNDHCVFSQSVVLVFPAHTPDSNFSLLYYLTNESAYYSLKIPDV